MLIARTRKRRTLKDRPKHTSTIASTLALALALGTAAFAPEVAQADSGRTVTDEGSKARVNLSARLRSLTEDVAATSCRIVSETAVDGELRHLKNVTSTFETILAGLEHGDDRLGIPTQESRAMLLNNIAAVRALWDPMHAATDRLIDGTASADDYALIAATHRDLLEKTQALVSNISGVYSDPMSLLQKDAVTLNFMGRQRSLATRLARTTCGVYSGNEAIGTQAELDDAASKFGMTYSALIQGFPSAGIAPPPNDMVKSVLEESLEHWKTEEAKLQSMGAQSAELVKATATFAKDSVRETNNAITLYMIASPGQSDVFSSALKSYAEDQLFAWLSDPLVIESVHKQNDRHADLSEDAVIALDKTWRAEAKGGEGDLIKATLANPLSVWLDDKATGTAGIVTEVFVMDNKGLNVGQSAQTSDFWQGDEAKWQETYGKGTETLHISELEFDDSTGSYQTQVSKIIRDPETGDIIGAVTFGINVMNLL